jgi:hypothetical protein
VANGAGQVYGAEGGIGGGGTGDITTTRYLTHGVPNTGGGGGGASWSGTPGSGGSGIVILRYQP